MKVCELCGVEIWTRDGENQCVRCEGNKIAIATNRNIRDAKLRRASRVNLNRIYSEILGLVKVKGNMGGTYWE